MNRLRRLEGALVLADDMAGAPEHDRLHLPPRRFERFGRGVAQRRHLEHARRRFALCPPLGVFAFRQLVADVRVDDQDGYCGVGHRHRGGGARAAVQQQRVIFPGEDGGELVHDAARHAGKVVFGPLAQQRLLNRVERLAGHRFEQGGGGDLQRGAAGEPAAIRQGGFDDRVEAADFFPKLLESGDDAPDVIGPAGLAALDLGAQAEGGRFPWGRAVQGHLAAGVGVPSHEDVAFDRHGQHEAVVVIGMLTDQVHTARGRDHPAGRMTKTPGEQLARRGLP